MTNKKNLIFSLLILTIILTACDSGSDPLPENYIPKENMIVFDAKWERSEVENNKGLNGKIVICDFYNPDNFYFVKDTSAFHHGIDEYSPGFFISTDTVGVFKPIFSNDKNKLSFNDCLHGFGHNTNLGIYDLENGEIYYPGINSYFGTYKIQLFSSQFRKEVWCGDKGIYFTVYGSSTGEWNTYYDFQKEEYSNKAGAYPVCIIGADTLVAYFDPSESDDDQGLYFFNFSGNNLGKLNNPFFKLRDTGRGYSVLNALDFDWNEKLRRFVYLSSIDSNSKAQLFITDLKGSFNKQITFSDYYKRNPCWGPENKYILFNRADHSDYINNIYVVNLETLEEYPFAAPVKYRGAEIIKNPDY